ncbi:hypothetical protein K501DRAFT_329610 [Backusella circina FSU 941]|nr:hypothetical protein K501DRAFT_329610 [Backusella circina FSU 941]
MNSDKQKSFQCDDCKLDFNSQLKLANHKYDAHLNSLAVYLENECSSKLNSPTTFRRHLKKHNAHCETTSVCEYDSPQVIESQAQKLSTMFQSIAHSVINDGAAATVSVDVFQKVHDQLPHDSTAAPIISQIIALSEYGQIRIINNTALDSLLQPLAKSMVTSIRNANNIAVKLLSRYLRT